MFEILKKGGQPETRRSESGSLRPQLGLQETCALFRCAYLGVEIDMHNAKALTVTVRPFKVIQQTPNIVATDIHTFSH
jgi:hypothetical protein